MLKIGLTGGIGSGKSLVGDIFTQLGIPVFRADEQARIIREENRDIQQEIQRAFGTHDPARLARLVFSDKGKLQQLNAIIHPAVQEKYKHWLLLQTASVTMKEAAILFESGTHKELDKIITVSAPKELRISRVMKRDGTERKAVLARMKNQWSENKRLQHADFTILNDGKRLLLPQVVELAQKLL